MTRLGRLLSISLLLAGSLSAQSVRVRAVDAATDRPLVGVAIMLLDSIARPVAQSTTDSSGSARLRAPRAGTYRIQAELSGWLKAVTDPFAVSRLVTTTVRMTAAPALPGDIAPRTAETTTAYGELRGRVVSADDRAIGGADVAIPGLDSTFSSDSDGRFRVGDLPEGPVVVRIAAIGYAPVGLVFRISRDRRLVDTTLVLRPVAQALAPLEVAAPSPPVIPKLEEFERRRRFGIGTFLTRAALAKWETQPLSAALRTVRGVRLVPRRSACGGGFAAGSTRSDGASGCLLGPGCAFSVYVDGARLYDGEGPAPNIDDYFTDRVEAIEVYRGAGEAPVEYNATGSLCGVLIIWTRVGGA